MTVPLQSVGAELGVNAILSAYCKILPPHPTASPTPLSVLCSWESYICKLKVNSSASLIKTHREKNFSSSPNSRKHGWSALLTSGPGNKGRWTVWAGVEHSPWHVLLINRLLGLMCNSALYSSDTADRLQLSYASTSGQKNLSATITVTRLTVHSCLSCCSNFLFAPG